MEFYGAVVLTGLRLAHTEQTETFIYGALLVFLQNRLFCVK